MLLINLEVLTGQRLSEIGIIKSIFLSSGTDVKHWHAALLCLMHLPPDPEIVHFAHFIWPIRKGNQKLAKKFLLCSVSCLFHLL